MPDPRLRHTRGGARCHTYLGCVGGRISGVEWRIRGRDAFLTKPSASKKVGLCISAYVTTALLQRDRPTSCRDCRDWTFRDRNGSCVVASRHSSQLVISGQSVQGALNSGSQSAYLDRRSMLAPSFTSPSNAHTSPYSAAKCMAPHPSLSSSSRSSPSQTDSA